MEIEDLHWVDKTSEAYLTAFIERVAGAGILLLTTYRPDYRPPWLAKSYAIQIALQSLAPQDAVTVVHSIRQQHALSGSLEQIIIDKAQGNPFFLEELTRVVLEHGGTGTTINVPDTIHGVLSARIDRLPEDTKRLLQTAAVLGREFSPRLLEALWEGSGSLEPLLAELRRLEFLYERAGADEPLFVFTHALTQEIAYESLLTTRRQRLHAAAGHAMERLCPDWLTEHAEALAYHFTHGAVWEQAFVYLARSGDKARQAYANQDATHSAYVASVLTSLIATYLHAGGNALEYLVALQAHRAAVFADPAARLPWKPHPCGGDGGAAHGRQTEARV